MSFLGLKENEVIKLREKFGYNELPIKDSNELFRVFLSQLKNPMIYVLFAVFILSLFLNKVLHAIIVFVIMLIVILLGFFNEYKASKEIKALKNLVIPKTIVIRNGKKENIPTRDLVPGDIVYLSEGDIVPADGFILRSKDLKIDESVLTGESDPVDKEQIDDDLLEKIIVDPKGFLEILDKIDDRNKVFMSTNVVQGYAYIKITHTGLNTKFGRIASLMKSETKQRFDLVTKPMENFTLFAFFIVLLTFFMLLFRELPNYDNLISFFSSNYFFSSLTVVLAMLVSGIPEGLPLVVTLALALGMKRLSRKNVIVNKMNSLEALGKISFICVDKTGTLTKNQLTVERIFFNNRFYQVSGVGYNTLGKVTYRDKPVDRELNLLTDAMLLCNNSELKDITETMWNDKGQYFEVIGSKLEGALLVLGEKLNRHKVDLDLKFPKLEEIPFNSNRKFMATLHNYPFTKVLHNEYDSIESDFSEKDLEQVLFVKGAAEFIVDKSTKRIENNRIVNITASYKKNLHEIINKLSSKGYKTLGIAVKRLTKKHSKIDESLINDLIFLGLIFIRDPPREDVSKAIKISKQAGIKIMMITGDHLETAKSIAKDVGLLDSKDSLIVNAKDLRELTDDELDDIIENINICARATPEDKLRIVESLQRKNYVVAMTGDGVNDALALKKADIGIALGSATDVAREASDIILKDDSFISIVNSIEEGRRIFENLQKFTSYQFACNIAELLTVFSSVLFNLPLALNSLQILFMNLVTDDLPAIALANNPPSKDIMEWKPNKHRGLFTKNLFVLMVFAGLFIGTLTFIVFFHYIKTFELTITRGITLFSLITLEILLAISFKSFRKPWFKIDLSNNKFLLYSIILSLILTLLIYITPLKSVFEVSLFDWKILLLISGIFLVLVTIFDYLKIKIMKSYYSQ